MLEIDCSRGEGGGQAVRTSVAMAAITGKATHLTRIRENRPTNGLSKQHCTAVEAVAAMTGSTVIGNTFGSQELTVIPGTEKEYDIVRDVGSAGSITLVLQAMILASRNHDKPVRMDITGGTNVMWAPPIDYYRQLLFPLMARTGLKADLDIIQRGFYPEGGGRVVVTLEPMRRISPLTMHELGELRSIKGTCFVQNLPGWLGDQLMEGCMSVLGGYDVDIAMERTEDGTSKGAGMSLVAEYDNGVLGSNVLTSRSHPARQAGIDVANDLVKNMASGATMDVHTADQILPYLAMADGDSSFTVSKISRHLLSQMDTLETFLDVRFGVVRRGGLYHLSVTPGAEA